MPKRKRKHKRKHKKQKTIKTQNNQLLHKHKQLTCTQVVEYKEQNGHCRLPNKYKANPQLGSWVNRQRQLRKKNILLPEQIKSLEGLDLNGNYK